MTESSNKPSDGPSDDPNSLAGRLMTRWTSHRTSAAGLIGVGLAGIGLDWRLHVHGPEDALRACHEVFAPMAVLACVAALASRGLSVQPPTA